MPRMTNAKSAPVLNSADEFERKLNWQLFVAEQEALLAYNPSVGADGYSVWNVGEPINEYMDGELIDLAGEYVYSYDSAACYRPMIELINYDGVDTALKPNCDDCDVLWDGDEPCFVCGGPRNEPWSVSFQEIIQASRRTAQAMRPVVRRAMERAVENERFEWRRVPEQVRGVRADYVLFDETSEEFYAAPNDLRLRWANSNERIDHVGWSNYPTPEQARLQEQTVSYLANALDIPPEIIASTPSGVPSFHEQVQAINRMSVEPYHSTVVDVEIVGIGPLPRPLAFVPTAQNPQNTRRRPRIAPDTNRSYPTSEPNWRRRRPKRA